MPRDGGPVITAPLADDGVGGQPFANAEEAWFWLMRWRRAWMDGARFRAGRSDRPRPCEPVDILRVVDRLYRARRLDREHLAVLGHYGRRDMPPCPRRPAEYRASRLWAEAMERLDGALRLKGLVA